MEEVNTVYLSIGSNLGDRLSNLNAAIALLKENNCTILKTSTVYESEAIGFDSDDRFYNAALKIETKTPPLELLNTLKEIEKLLGRGPTNKELGYQSRTIDLDIIFFNSLTLKHNELIIPHPHFHERLFVLKPLIDIIDPTEVLLVDLVQSHYIKAQGIQMIDETTFKLIH